MSTSQQHLPSTVFDNQTNNACDEKDEVAHLRTSPPRVAIMRSNSAPHAHNRIQSHHKSATTHNLNSKQSSNRKMHTLDNKQQNIPTLSDGVIHINHQQAVEAATCVLASHKQIKHHYSGSTNFSSTPLCDTNHLGQGQNENPGHVWYYQDIPHPLKAEMSTCSPTVPRGAHFEQGDKFGPMVGDHKHKLNGIRKNSVPCLIETSEDISNGGVTMRRTGYDNYKLPTNELQPWDIVHEFHEIRKQHQKRQCDQKQVQSEVILPSDMQRILALASVKEKGYARLEEELSRAQKALEMKDEEVDELKGIRERLMKEVSDFTASLFEEVNAQLNEAATSEQLAKKQLFEARSKIDMLSAEVAALKDLVLTSTPSSPNKHLHPQIDTSNKKDKGGKPFWQTHRRSTSHHQFTKESREKAEASEQHSHLKELDTVAFDEFQRWRLQPTMEFSGQFFARVQLEDIQPCLNFKNKTLAERVIESVRSNSLSIEPIPGDQSYPRRCCLSESHKLCNYKIKFEEDDQWYSISQMSRNRIAAVCDFYAYLRYIVQGLVKCPDKDMFVELVRLRNQMAQARLGLV